MIINFTIVSYPSLSATFKKNSLKFSEFFPFMISSQFCPYKPS